MTSRQRVRCALSNQLPDRVPIDLAGTRGTGISAGAYQKLRARIGSDDSRPYMYDLVQHLVYPEQPVLDRFHVDVIDGGQAFRHPPAECRCWPGSETGEVSVPNHFRLETDEDGNWYVLDPAGEVRVGKKAKGAHYFTQIHWSYQQAERIPRVIKREDLQRNLYGIPIHPWDLDLASSDQFEHFAKGLRGLYENTEYAIALTVGCQILEMGQYVRGIDNFLCDLYLDEPGVRRLLDAFLEIYMERLQRTIEAAGPYVETLRFVDDLGTQQGPLLDPAMYRRLIKPYHQAMWEYVHAHSGCKVTLHSCGAVADFIPELLDAGLDALNPIQTSASGMEPERLKREFGRDLVFWGGGCDTQSILPRASPAEVSEHVKERVRILGARGGLIFSQIHNIQPEVPADNIVAMLDAAFEYGSSSL